MNHLMAFGYPIDCPAGNIRELPMCGERLPRMGDRKVSLMGSPINSVDFRQTCCQACLDAYVMGEPEPDFPPWVMARRESVLLRSIEHTNSLLARARDVLASLPASVLAEQGEAYLIDHIVEELK